jgi:two-component system, sensor histidine kinase ChiS
VTIRARLVASVGLLLLFSLALVGYGVTAVQLSFARRDADRRIEVIVNSVQRAAEDALLQKDDVLLVSYIKFLQAQYPSLSYAQLQWSSGIRARGLRVGEPRTGPQMLLHALHVTSAGDPQNRVAVQLGIDRDQLGAQVSAGQERLVRTFVGVAAVILLFGVLFAYWFARSVTEPIQALSHLAQEIGRGKLGMRLEWRSDDELGRLVEAFNGMSVRLEELDEAKKTFVSSVTHELRSPLGAIESFLQLLKDKVNAGDKGPQTDEYLGRIQANVHRLTGFINDLLDVAKIEKGRMECTLRPMRLQEVAGEVGQFFEARARQQGVSLLNELPSNLPTVQGDPDRLRQVLVNLVANSLKFTATGGVIRVTGEQFREGTAKWVEIAVSDTGRGLAEGDQTRLFKAFSQGKNVTDGVIGSKGTGLGLYIVKSIIDQHGGKIDVRSTPGKGTQFRFSVKAA